MANNNQGYRSGNAFGRLSNTNFSSYDTDRIAMKAGHLVKLRGNRMCMVTGVEPLAVDLWFTDTLNVGTASAATLNGDDATPLTQYGALSIQAYFDLHATSEAASTRYGNILKPDYDSGYITFSDLEPYKTHLYQLCPMVDHLC